MLEIFHIFAENEFLGIDHSHDFRQYLVADLLMLCLQIQQRDLVFAYGHSECFLNLNLISRISRRMLLWHFRRCPAKSSPMPHAHSAFECGRTFKCPARNRRAPHTIIPIGSPVTRADEQILHDMRKVGKCQMF